MYLRLVLGRRLEPKCRSGLDQLRAKWGVDASLPTLISQDRKVLPEPTRAFPGNHNHSAHQEKNAVLHVSHNVLSFISESFVSYIFCFVQKLQTLRNEQLITPLKLLPAGDKS